MQDFTRYECYIGKITEHVRLVLYDFHFGAITTHSNSSALRYFYKPKTAIKHFQREPSLVRSRFLDAAASAASSEDCPVV